MDTDTQSEQRERGAMLLEFALVAPLIIMLVIGTVTIGLSYNSSISLNSGARESARYAATLPVSGDMSAWLNSVADVAKEASIGELADSTNGQNLCIAYVYPDGSDTHDQTVSLIEVGGSRIVSPGSTCFTDGRPSGERRVQISVGRIRQVQTGVYSSDIDLDARAVARFERA